MLQNIKKLYGHKLAAADGYIGRVKDLFFDDKTWTLRYLVADTGSWLSGRLVLLSPDSFGILDQCEKILHVRLHKKQIENSPPIESHRPVSRQNEIENCRYYGWPAYWDGATTGDPMFLPPAPDEAVNGYQIQTVDLNTDF